MVLECDMHVSMMSVTGEFYGGIVILMTVNGLACALPSFI